MIACEWEKHITKHDSKQNSVKTVMGDDADRHLPVR